MHEIIKAAEAIILAEAKIDLKPWEQELMTTCKKVAEAIDSQNQKPTEASEEEVIKLLKNL